MNTLPELAYEILRYLTSDDHESEQIKLLNHFSGKINETSALLFELEKSGFISCENSLRGHSALINITHMGRSVLAAHDENTDYLHRQIAALENLVSTLKTESENLRNDFDDYRTNQSAYHTAQKIRAKKAERISFWRNIISDVVSAVIGGLVVYYWPSIVAFFSGVIQ